MMGFSVLFRIVSIPSVMDKFCANVMVKPLSLSVALQVRVAGDARVEDHLEDSALDVRRLRCEQYLLELKIACSIRKNVAS